MRIAGDSDSLMLSPREYLSWNEYWLEFSENGFDSWEYVSEYGINIFESDAVLSVNSVKGSAKLIGGETQTEIVLSDDVFLFQGILIDDNIKETILKENNSCGIIEIQTVYTPNFSMDVYAHLVDKENETVDIEHKNKQNEFFVSHDDMIEYWLFVKNTGGVSLDPMTVQCDLGYGLEFIPGTASVFSKMDLDNPDKFVKTDLLHYAENLTTSGSKIDTLFPNREICIVFNAKVVAPVERVNRQLLSHFQIYTTTDFCLDDTILHTITENTQLYTIEKWLEGVIPKIITLSLSIFAAIISIIALFRSKSRNASNT